VLTYASLASCAQLASYLCLLIYVTLSISCYANKGEIEGFASQLRTKSKHKTTLSISPSLLIVTEGEEASKR
jgi:hypothetical protein